MENYTVTRVEQGNCCCAETLKRGNAQFVSCDNSQKVKQCPGTVRAGGSQFILSIPSSERCTFFSLSKSATLTFLKLTGSSEFSSFNIVFI